MHSTSRLYEQPRKHRLDSINHCALSDCCGAPIIRGGICFDCRERCDEEDEDPRPARFGRQSISDEDRRSFGSIERPLISFCDGDIASVLNRISLKSVSD